MYCRLVGLGCVLDAGLLREYGAGHVVHVIE